jgi:MFS superfamily sulfate permease-like transporter
MFSLFRVGRSVSLFPPAAVHGLLCAIGVIILSKQIHVLLGASPEKGGPLSLLAQVPNSLAEALTAPKLAAFGLGSLVLALLWPRLGGIARRIPAPLVVVCVSLLAVVTFGALPDAWMVRVPDSLLAAIVFPDFSAVLTPVGAKYVGMFAVVGTIESVLSARAVDLVDPKRRNTDPDRDLLAVGVANVVASLIGGLPMITEVVRSSANAASGAVSRLSNVFHGVFLLAFVSLAPWLIQLLPLPALAAILVVVGARLASPKAALHAMAPGPIAAVVFVSTVVVTLISDLLVGVSVGVALHVASSRALRLSPKAPPKAPDPRPRRGSFRSLRLRALEHRIVAGRGAPTPSGRWIMRCVQPRHSAVAAGLATRVSARGHAPPLEAGAEVGGAP